MRRMIAATIPGPAAAFVWALAVVRADVWPSGPALLLGVWLVVAATVALVGMVAGSSRWAHRLGIGVSIAGLGLAVVLPVGPLWWTGVILSGLSTAALAGPLTSGLIRRRVAASGPPLRAVALALTLFITPAVLALAGVDGLGSGWVWVAGAGLALVVYLRALPGAVLATRGVAPVAAAIGAIGAPLPVAAACLVTGAAVTGLAWTRDARLSVRPLTEPGKPVPIPPELAPSEVLDAAGIDSRGRRKERE